MSFKKTFIILIVLCSLASMVSFALSKKPTASSKFKSTEKTPVSKSIKPAANFVATDLTGKKIELSAYKNKVILLDFWATWCPPCVASAPHLKAIAQKYAKDVQLIGVSLDQSDAPVKEFVKANGVPYPIVMENAQIRAGYPGIQAIPTLFIIDRNFTIQAKLVGYHSQSDLESAIKPFL